MRIFYIFMMLAATGAFAQEGLENLAFEKPVKQLLAGVANLIWTHPC